jgi:lipid-binding SYLF domain-containing protein
MSKAWQTRTALTLAWAVAALTACASSPTRDDAQARVDAAEQTLTNFTRDPDMTWFRDHVGQAKALLISPRILQAGFIFGGSGGEALVIARNRGGAGWSSPAFYHMGTGSVGLQAGAQASETVALVMTDKALNSLLSNSFKLGGDVSVAAGPVGVGAGHGRHDRLRALEGAVWRGQPGRHRDRGRRQA